ncbi:MAG TPA: hypothetical protein VKR54_03650 [Candidatus Babeliales bacterium]|jgi:hypothetical protein|nr:hypothetical protein [Candidatus Babeliales bacterium]
MKRIFCVVVVCVATSFLYSSENQPSHLNPPHPTPKMSPRKSSDTHIKITFPKKNRPRIDSDPIVKLVTTSESRSTGKVEEKK